MTRPSTDAPEKTTFECLKCGFRTSEDVEGRVCPECGGELRDISLSRDY